MSTKWLWLIVTFAGPLLVIGIPYWQVPYNSVDPTEALLGPGALFVLGVAALAKVFAPASLATITGIICAAMVTVVCVRIGMDTALDPTTHNLLPFEIIIAIVIGAGEGLIGALAGALLSALARRLRETVR